MPDFSEDLFFSTAVQLNGRLVAKEFSALELARTFAERLEKLGPRFNALALSLREDALVQAKKVDKELKRGRTRGPLQGVPYAVKDLLATARRPTAWGAAPFAGQVFEEDAAVIRKLQKNGALLIGKLAMVELAGGGGYRYPSASVNGPGLNPWDRARWSGGSSSGSAAAVAAGLVPYALGSETNGSIVTPCAFCGVTGLRPTYGLVSRSGAMALAWTMDKIGPIARSAEDCGHILQAISGGDSTDPGSSGKSFRFAPDLTPPLAGLRVGYAQADFDVHADAPLRAPLQAALEAIRQITPQMSAAELPEFPYSALASTIISAEGSTVFADQIQSGRADQPAARRQTAGLRAGRTIPASAYLQAMRIRRLVQQSLTTLFSNFDVLVSPARFSIAPGLTEALDRPAGPSTKGTAGGLRALVPAGNLAGLPALVLPCGFANGLPVSISLVGRPYSENTLLKLGLAFQAATTWHTRRPQA
ncbi:MAG: amidase [Acidobacteria bacterium]|nr:amidase [Acidobacteriota bacterium]